MRPCSKPVPSTIPWTYSIWDAHPSSLHTCDYCDRCMPFFIFKSFAEQPCLPATSMQEHEEHDVGNLIAGQQEWKIPGSDPA